MIHLELMGGQVDGLMGNGLMGNGLMGNGLMGRRGETAIRQYGWAAKWQYGKTVGRRNGNTGMRRELQRKGTCRRGPHEGEKWFAHGVLS
jgi:hypothetical protein